MQFKLTTLIVLALCTLGFALIDASLVQAATLTQSAVAPTVDGDDIAQLIAGPVADDLLRSVFNGKPAQGQTFTTGSNPGGYSLNAITVQALWGQTINTLYIDVGTVNGTVLTPITPTYACGGIAAGMNNYITYTMDAPLHLEADTVYGFNLSPYNWSSASGGFNLVTGNGDSYDGGSLYISGLEPTNTYGYPDNDNLDIHTDLDRVFHLDIDAVPEPTSLILLSTGLFGLLVCVWRRQ